MSQRYNVVFTGALSPGQDASRVQARVGETFGLSAQQVGLLFQGGRVIVKRGVPKRLAQHYLLAFERTGAICEMVPCSEVARTPSAGQYSIHPPAAHSDSVPSSPRPTGPGGLQQRTQVYGSPVQPRSSAPSAPGSRVSRAPGASLPPRSRPWSALPPPREPAPTTPYLDEIPDLAAGAAKGVLTEEPGSGLPWDSGSRARPAEPLWRSGPEAAWGTQEEPTVMVPPREAASEAEAPTVPRSTVDTPLALAAPFPPAETPQGSSPPVSYPAGQVGTASARVEDGSMGELYRSRVGVLATGMGYSASLIFALGWLIKSLLDGSDTPPFALASGGLFAALCCLGLLTRRIWQYASSLGHARREQTAAAASLALRSQLKYLRLSVAIHAVALALAISGAAGALALGTTDGFGDSPPRQSSQDGAVTIIHQQAYQEGGTIRWLFEAADGLTYSIGCVPANASVQQCTCSRSGRRVRTYETGDLEGASRDPWRAAERLVTACGWRFRNPPAHPTASGGE